MNDQLFTDGLIAYCIQYIGLGIVFWFGMWVAFKQGDIGLQTPRQKRWLFTLGGGYFLYAAVHGFFQFVAVRF